MIRENVPENEQRYNELALKACNSMNEFICESSHGEGLFTLVTSWQYKYISRRIPEGINQVLEDICALKFKEEISQEDASFTLSQQMRMWLEKRLSVLPEIPRTSSGKVKLPFVEIVFSGCATKRGVEFFAYLNALKTLLFEKRCYVSARLDLEECREYVNGNEVIPLVTMEELEEVYQYVQEEVPEGYSKPTRDFWTLLFLQEGIFTKAVGIKGVYIYDYQNSFLTKIVHFAAYSINKGIRDINGWRGVSISYDKLRKAKLRYSFVDFLKYWEAYWLIYTIRMASEKNVSYKKMCEYWLKNKYSPLDEFITVDFWGGISEQDERKTVVYKDFLYMRSIFEETLGINLDEELESLYEIKRKKDGAGQEKKAVVAEAKEKSKAAENDDEVPAAVGAYVKAEIAEVYARLYQEIQNTSMHIENNVKVDMVQINKRIDMVEETYVAIFDDIEKTCADIMSTVTEMSKRMIEYDDLIITACAEKKEKPLSVLVQNKIEEYRILIREKYPMLEVGDSFLFSLALMVCPNALEEIEKFLEDISAGTYRINYISKITAKQLTIYTYESNLGVCSVYKKDGKVYIFDLEMQEQLQMKEVQDFVAKCAKNCFAGIYYDGDIFTKVEKLLKAAGRSIYMIAPWVYEYPAIECYGNILREAEARKVSIHLKYGYLSQGSRASSNQQSLENFKESTRIVKKLKEEYIPSLEYKDDDTHIKALVIDNRMVFIGSCNYLSFRYNYAKNPDFRHETMVLIDDPELAADLITYYEM